MVVVPIMWRFDIATTTAESSAGLQSRPPSQRIVHPFMSRSSPTMALLTQDLWYFTKQDTHFQQQRIPRPQHIRPILWNQPPPTQHHVTAPAVHIRKTVSHT